MKQPIIFVIMLDEIYTIVGLLLQQKIDEDSYGKASIKLTPNSGDGSYIDVKDKESLKNYVVTKQSIEPNTKLTFDIGDYDVAKNQNIEEIELSVAAIEK